MNIDPKFKAFMDNMWSGLGQTGLTLHQCIVIGNERAQLIGTMRQCHEHIRNEPCLFLNLLHHGANVGWQACQIWHRVSADGSAIVHFAFLTVIVAAHHINAPDQTGKPCCAHLAIQRCHNR